jgi:Xaa-Pro aminopeptidase
MADETNATTPLEATPADTAVADLTPAAVRKRTPMSKQLLDWLGTDWEAAPVVPHPAQDSGVAEHTARRRAELSARLPGQLIVAPAGQQLTRANDTQFPFRASSAFVWLTGETAEGSVLVMTPRSGGGHEATLYVRAYHHAGSERYFTDHQFGAIWVGNVPTPSQTGDVLAITTRPLTDLPGEISGWRDESCALLSGHDPLIDPLFPRGSSDVLAPLIDELRLTKDDWEISRLTHACAATSRGFADVAREIPLVLDRPVRGERWLEGTFWRRARLEGNDVGYTSIVGSGAHATTLHWWRNHGQLHSGDLLLADMGIETDEIHTADVTRTFPLDGQWSPPQRMVYAAVLEAQAAGIAECRIGNDFLAPHRAAMWVLAEHLHSWGILDVPAAVACSEDPERPGAGQHRRFTLHGTSHSLGLDVHDCANARDEVYHKGPLGNNHVLTVEPGLYFQPNDRRVPAELRDIGVRIEDDIHVTEAGPVNLSGMLPRDPDEVVAWMRQAQATSPDV